MRLSVAGKYVIDIGAYIGDTAIYFALKGARKVFAVEPYPYTYRLLAENIKINSLGTIIRPFNVAIGDSDKMIHLPYMEEDTIAKSTHDQGSGVKVACHKLSSFINALKRDKLIDGELV